MRRCSFRSSLVISISSPQPIVGQPATVFPCRPAGGSPLLPYLPSLHRSFTQVSVSLPYFQPSPPGDIQVLARLSAVLSESETLSKSQFCSGSSLRGHLEWAPWKPNKGAGQLLSMLELRGAVGSVWSVGGYLGNTSVEFLNLSALLFSSNYILMLLLSWKLEQSLTSTWSIMYKLVALEKILHILSITVGCWWAHAAGPGLIITCLRACGWGRKPHTTAPMLGLPLEAEIGTAKTSFRVICDVSDDGGFFSNIQLDVNVPKRVVLLSHLKYDTGSQTVICLIRFICVWINFLRGDGTWGGGQDVARHPSELLGGESKQNRQAASRISTEISPVRWSEVGLTPHLLKNASVSGSTTSRRVTLPPTLMAATTSECVFPSTDMPFTCKGKQGDFWTRLEITKNMALFVFCFPPQSSGFILQYYHFVWGQRQQGRKSCGS